MDDRDDVGGTYPTAHRKATAQRLLELHRDIGIPINSFCSWCRKPWPCPDAHWSRTVLDRAAATEPAPPLS